MAEWKTGRVVRSLSGYYDVVCGGKRYECRGRGRLRAQGLSPQVGDEVQFSPEHGKGMIENVLPRRNSFVRPAVSNLDALVILASGAIPVTEPYLIDRVTAIAGDQGVEVLLCINKCDLDPAPQLCEIYRSAGYAVFPTSAETGEGIDALWRAIRGKTVALTGNSGVGKSSVLNRMAPLLGLKTGDVSEKLGRGRHTTRHVELFALADGTFVIDTPGFSAFDTDEMELILKENLQYAFPDFAPYVGRCRFPDCAHLCEPDCAVRQALERGALQRSRYDSYVRLYERAKEIKTWERKP